MGESFGIRPVFAQGGQDPGGQGVGLENQHQRLLALFDTPGVVFTDAEETRGRLVVGVTNRGLQTAIRRRLAALGIPQDSVDIVETPAIVPLTTLRDHTRPVMAGAQIRYSGYLCTLGFNAVRNGVAGYVTAAHCSDRQGEVDGTLYYQPIDKVPDEFIGREVTDPPFFRNGKVCPKRKKCRYSDTNFSDGNDSAAFAPGIIARTTGPNNGSLEIAGEFAISAEGSSVAGDVVNKVGRTTGWTQGVVTRTCAHTGVSGSSIVNLCQDFVSAAVGGGDSGAPVFRINPDGSVTLLGTLWGGTQDGRTFIYSPMANIERELGTLEAAAPGF